MKEDLFFLSSFSHYDPHRILGLHGGKIFIWRPKASKVYLEVLGKIVEACPLDASGLFVYALRESLGPLDYRIYHHDGSLAFDPYVFSPTITEMDLFLFNKGCHYELYRVLGAKIKTINGVKGVRFAVWAPNARGVSLVADFNHFDGRAHPMRSLGVSGVWELFIPQVGVGEKYKFEIHTKEGECLIKSDPFAFSSELRPLTASIVADVDAFAWSEYSVQKGAMIVYEVHLGSWREKKNYQELAVELAIYCKEMGFTHVELLPIMEHPLDESWGYQVTGFFAVTSRFGSVLDFQFFVDHLHKMGIGVILDWVPAHFPVDAFALHQFDGTALYEHEDPRKGFHPHWNTAIFNYGRKEVCNFLIASALFWLDVMHVDGIRVDAVASMLYLDYGRKEGEWVPNPDGSRYNLDAIEFIKHLNSIIHQRFPSAIMIAEESSSFSQVTYNEGLGFDLKWNMGWMNDTLRYIKRDPIYRKHHQGELTFGLLYAFSEKFISVLSHDEVVHGKGSLLSKMPGPDFQKFAGLRLLYSYMVGYPGKKLLFMGGEIGQWAEWNCLKPLDWYLLEYPMHAGLQKMVLEINHLYLAHPQLWEKDFDWEGYEWVDFLDAERSVISYLRKGQGGSVLFLIHHFSTELHSSYRVFLKNVKKVVEIFNSDDGKYGGSNLIGRDTQIFGDCIEICLPALSTVIFEIEYESSHI